MAGTDETIEPIMGKRAARTAAKELRDRLPKERLEEWSIMACEQAAQWLEREYSDCRSMLLYVPFRSELNLRPLMEWGWRRGIAVIVPRCLPEQRLMALYRIHGWDELASGAYGIMEPDPSIAAYCGDAYVPDIVFVPGLAFDRHGGRLGYGGGYYDRFYDRLRDISLREDRMMPLWIGCGFEQQLVAEVPMEGHDARVGAILTEQGMRMTDQVIAFDDD